MTITIPCDTDDGEAPLVITNDRLDNDSYVELKSEDFPALIVPVSDLLAAVTAFSDLRKSRLEDESLIK